VLYKLLERISIYCEYSSIVIEDARTASSSGHCLAPVFFYCSRNTAEPTRSNPDAIIASLAKQLSSPHPGGHLLPPTVTAYRTREMDGFASGTLGIDESRALIIQLAEKYPLITIVIDALDECDPDRRADLLTTLERILQESPNLVKIFVSSRDDQDIVWHLRNYPNLELSSNNNGNDITSFVRNETQELIKNGKLLRFSTNKEELKGNILKQVTKGANGMSVLSSMASHDGVSLIGSLGSGGPACHWKCYAASRLMKAFGKGSGDCRGS